MIEIFETLELRADVRSPPSMIVQLLMKRDLLQRMRRSLELVFPLSWHVETIQAFRIRESQFGLEFPAIFPALAPRWLCEWRSLINPTLLQIKKEYTPVEQIAVHASSGL